MRDNRCVLYPALEGGTVSDSTTLPPLAELLSEAEVAELNAAQRTLRRAAERARDGSWRHPAPTAYSLGLFVAAADVARDAIFDALNVGSSHGVLSLTRAQLHDDSRDAPVQS